MLLDDDDFVDEVTESKLPAGATIGRHLGVKTIAFALPEAVYRFPTTQLWRQTMLTRTADHRVSFTADATQCIVKFLFDQHPHFPVQVAPAACGSFAMSGLKEKKGQVWVASKEFVCAAIRDGCPTKFYAGFTVENVEVCSFVWRALSI
jgi:hypothetical protein